MSMLPWSSVQETLESQPASWTQSPVHLMEEHLAFHQLLTTEKSHRQDTIVNHLLGLSRFTFNTKQPETSCVYTGNPQLLSNLWQGSGCRLLASHHISSGRSTSLETGCQTDLFGTQHPYFMRKCREYRDQIEELTILCFYGELSFALFLCSITDLFIFWSRPAILSFPS